MGNHVAPWCAGEGLVVGAAAGGEHGGGTPWGAVLVLSVRAGWAAGAGPPLLCTTVLGGAAATMLKA
eukprot:4516122-Heterocapsa_arctica.AAC.1